MKKQLALLVAGLLVIPALSLSAQTAPLAETGAPAPLAPQTSGIATEPHAAPSHLLTAKKPAPKHKATKTAKKKKSHHAAAKKKPKSSAKKKTTVKAPLHQPAGAIGAAGQHDATDTQKPA